MPILQPIMDAAFSPDGTALATASLDGEVMFFQVHMYAQEQSSPRYRHSVIANCQWVSKTLALFELTPKLVDFILNIILLK